MREPRRPATETDNSADEIRGLKHINLHLFRRELQQVKSTAEFRLQHAAGPTAASTADDENEATFDLQAI